MEAIETPADELQTQSLPLEEVWPVERLEPKSPMNVQKVETSPTVIQAQPVELPVEETAQVQKLLQDVQPGQPTDLKLEVVTPRRPRPPVPAVDQGDNQGRIPGAVEAATPEPPVIQRSPESELSSPETLSPGQAPAGLNPELAQLWGMLDEIESDQSRLAIPASTDRPAPHESVTVSKEAGPAIQRAEQPAQPAVRSVYDENYPAARSPETSEIMSPPETPLVQRQEAAPASASQPAPEAGEAAGQPGKPDIDELARQVYAEVRRKLALEWERMRR